MSLVVGIDIGSTTTKVALVDSGQLLHAAVAATGVSGRRAAARLLRHALECVGREPTHVEFVAATGYGRRMLPFTDHVVTEIGANARGAVWLAGDRVTVRTIIDIGGQDSKVIALDERGRTTNFAMNDKCAAGTGRFLELMARVLEVELGELGELAVSAAEPCAINSLCAVFAESEVVSLLAQGTPVPSIAAGIHASIAKRTATLVYRVGLEREVFFDGGPALNAGMIRALEKELGLKLIVPHRPQVATAIGAALVAEQEHARRGRGKGVTPDALRDEG